MGVMLGFAEHVAPATDAHLVLAGPERPRGGRRPRGRRGARRGRGRLARAPAARRSRVHLACLPMADIEENAAIVNALQRHATVVVQKSLQEGFGLTVAEAMWKARPVVASAVGGIKDQIVDGETGMLLDDPRDLEHSATPSCVLLEDPRARARARRERPRARPPPLPRQPPRAPVHQAVREHLESSARAAAPRRPRAIPADIRGPGALRRCVTALPHCAPRPAAPAARLQRPACGFGRRRPCSPRSRRFRHAPAARRTRGAPTAPGRRSRSAGRARGPAGSAPGGSDHRGVALVEDLGEQLRVAVGAEHELGQVVGADRDAGDAELRVAPRG